MSKKELTQEEKDFKIDSFTLNNQLIYWVTKSNCMWSLKEANDRYDGLLDTGIGHPEAFEKLKRKMFESCLIKK